jgi:spermidine synthase
MNPTANNHSTSPWSFVPFALTIFTSAFLLFQVQPLISKQILPWFGGSPAVWTTAMLFFQSLLCLGYFYAHALASMSSRKTQARIHVVVLILAALLASRVLPGAELRPESPDSPVLQVLQILGLSVGLPYFCLATTGPLVQHWFTSTAHAKSVFRLYALSNVGSFLALLSFPYVLEPWLEQQQMGQLWTIGFWVFALLCLPVALGAWQNKAETANATVNLDPKTKLPIAQRLSWIALPALASLVFIAATDQISHDIAPEPRLWISTLGLYLVTFILTFDHPRWYRPRLFGGLALILLLLTAGMSDIPQWFGLEWDYGVNEVRWSHYALLFVVCMLCHGELYRRRPVDTRWLTEFYFCMSIGGAFGGLFVTLVATQWFDDYHEWLMALVIVALLATYVLFRTSLPRADGAGRLVRLGGVTTATGMVALLVVLQNPWSWREIIKPDRSEILLDQERNFYGTVSVKERIFFEQPELNERVFFSGSVTHGQQFLSDKLRHVPTTYYARDSGIGDTLLWAMSQKPNLSVALIGLGAGTLANYARPADAYDFYEINPAAVRFAQQWFDNLKSCKAAEQNIVLGDARLRMAQLPKDKRYDVIVLDAFTGGSVPIHLLTREAFQIYANHLKPDGYIAINITNAYLNLYPIVKAQSEVLGMAFRHKFQAADDDKNIRRNLHFIMTNDQAYLKAYPSVSREVRDDAGRIIGTDPQDQPGLRLWTDQFSSIAPIVK